jgi:hypothetical protein
MRLASLSAASCTSWDLSNPPSASQARLMIESSGTVRRIEHLRTQEATPLSTTVLHPLTSSRQRPRTQQMRCPPAPPRPWLASRRAPPAPRSLEAPAFASPHGSRHMSAPRAPHAPVPSCTRCRPHHRQVVQRHGPDLARRNEPHRLRLAKAPHRRARRLGTAPSTTPPRADDSGSAKTETNPEHREPGNEAPPSDALSPSRCARALRPPHRPSRPTTSDRASLSRIARRARRTKVVPSQLQVRLHLLSDRSHGVPPSRDEARDSRGTPRPG